MSRLIFLPVSILAGLLSGLLGKKLFNLAWRLVEEQEPPQAEHRRVDLGKLALSLAMQGAIFRAVKGLVDHASRVGFAGITGAWPGKEAPETAPEPE